MLRAEPERVLAFRVSAGAEADARTESEYLIKYKGCGASAARWLRIAELDHSATTIIDDYRRCVGLDAPPPASSLSSLSSSLSSSSSGIDDTQTEGKDEKPRELGDEGREEKLDHADDDVSWRSASRAVASAIASVQSIVPYVFDPDKKDPAPEWLNLKPSVFAASGVRLSDMLPAVHAELIIGDYMTWRSQPMTVPHSSMVAPHRHLPFAFSRPLPADCAARCLPSVAVSNDRNSATATCTHETSR